MVHRDLVVQKEKMEDPGHRKRGTSGSQENREFVDLRVLLVLEERKERSVLRVSPDSRRWVVQDETEDLLTTDVLVFEA